MTQMRTLTTIGDLSWQGNSARRARLLGRHVALATPWGHTRPKWSGIGAATDSGGTASDVSVQTTPELLAAAQALLTYMQTSGVPYELTATFPVQTFQADFVNAGNTLPASQHASNGVDGLYGPNTAAALAATLNTNVPPPNLTPPSPSAPVSPVSPPSPVTPPSPGPSPSPSSASGHGWIWILVLGAGGFVGYRMWKKRRGTRQQNPCHRCMHGRRR